MEYGVRGTVSSHWQASGIIALRSQIVNSGCAWLLAHELGAMMAQLTP